MNKYQNIESFFQTKGPEDIERFVDKNLDISQQVNTILNDKGWNQNDLAKLLSKSNAEVSKWLSGTHNLTLMSITKMEAALKTDIILTPEKAEKKYRQIEYVVFKVQANTNNLIPANAKYKNEVKRIEKTEKASKSCMAA